MESVHWSKNEYLKNRRNVVWNPKMSQRQSHSLSHRMARRTLFATGDRYAYDSNTSYRTNFEDKLVTLKEVLNRWVTRKLTLIHV